MSALTAQEQALVVQFKEKVKDVLKTKEQHEDSFLVRWLRASELDLKKSENMLRTSLKWREENNVDNILEAKLDPFIVKEFPYFIDGSDKFGNPVIYMPVGKYDFRKLASSGKLEEFKIYFAHMFEVLAHKIKEQNKDRDPSLPPVTQFSGIMDYAGFPFRQCLNIKAMQAMLQTFVIYESHYPELLGGGFYINCPSFFNVIFELLKTVAAPRTLAKIQVLGSNKKEWEPALRDRLGDENVSKILQRVNQR